MCYLSVSGQLFQCSVKPSQAWLSHTSVPQFDLLICHHQKLTTSPDPQAETWEIKWGLSLIPFKIHILPVVYCPRLMLRIHTCFRRHLRGPLFLPRVWQNPSDQFSSVAQLYLTLWPHELQHARPLCRSATRAVLRCHFYFIFLFLLRARSIKQTYS